MIASVVRFVTEEVAARRHRQRSAPPPGTASSISPPAVAVILAARNEEAALPATLRALKKNLPAANIYVGSDASTDRTVAMAEAAGCQVVALTHRGKANVLAYLLQHFQILERYQAVLIMDAEVIVSDTYLQTILPYFDDPTVAAFVSHARSRWPQHRWPRWSLFFAAYRIRLWLTLYYGLRYGQTWKHSNVTPIIPGGSSVYRSAVLARLAINTPGLIIEDFHMTFQVHRHQLGRITSHPSAYIIDQEPSTLRDYIRQVHRWLLGFWQTFFLHGFWPSFFWFATFAFTVEMLAASLFTVLVPFIVAALLVTPDSVGPWLQLTLPPFPTVTLTQLLVAVLVIDYGMTMLTAAIEGLPVLLLYGLGFFGLRYVDAIIFLWTLPQALFTTTPTGQWVSPARQGETPAGRTEAASAGSSL